MISFILLFFFHSTRVKSIYSRLFPIPTIDFMIIILLHAACMFPRLANWSCNSLTPQPQMLYN